jgi:hypothetical protein
MRTSATPRDANGKRAMGTPSNGGQKTSTLRNLQHLFELFAEDSQRNVRAGEREVRPPGAPTTGPDAEECGRWSKPLDGCTGPNGVTVLASRYAGRPTIP